MKKKMLHLSALLLALFTSVNLLSRSAAAATGYGKVSPETGDETNVFLIIAILVVAAAVAVVLVILGRKNNK